MLRTMGWMTTRVIVVSDLHLGGAPAIGDEPAFQMCGDHGRERLASFFDWVASQGGPNVELVLAGDVVDFLSEERAGGFQAFTADDAMATRKLRAIFGEASENPGIPDDALVHTRSVWTKLAAVAASGTKITILIGNHDIELSLPGPRRLLLDRLGHGRIELVYDNQAVTIGRVLIEHGNRYDDWNAVPHDALRRVRSSVSRGEPVTFDPLPGSIMVRDVVNKLKARLDFVDLLKPETAALLPLLAYLAPDEYRLAATVLKQRIRAARVKYEKDLSPADPDYVSAPIGAAIPVAVLGTGDDADDRLFARADLAATGPNANEVGAVRDFFARWRARLDEALETMELDALLEVLRAWSGATDAAFDPAQEDATYLGPAIECAARGFECVVFGHTHLAKVVPLRGQKTKDGAAIQHDALYLNTGTWADLMALPEAVLDRSAVNARDALRGFANDLAANVTAPWRSFVPTFADIELDDEGHVRKAGVFVFESPGSQPPISKDGMKKRLFRGTE